MEPLGAANTQSDDALTRLRASDPARGATYSTFAVESMVSRIVTLDVSKKVSLSLWRRVQLVGALASAGAMACLVILGSTSVSRESGVPVIANTKVNAGPLSSSAMTQMGSLNGPVTHGLDDSFFNRVVGTFGPDTHVTVLRGATQWSYSKKRHSLAHCDVAGTRALVAARELARGYSASLGATSATHITDSQTCAGVVVRVVTAGSYLVATFLFDTHDTLLRAEGKVASANP